MKRFQVMVAVLALVGLTSTAGAQQQRGTGADFSDPVFLSSFFAQLLKTQPVQNELKLTDEQKQKIENLRGDLENLFRGDRTGGPILNLNREELQQRREDLQQRRQERAKKADETVMTVLDEQQKKRLEEIRLQVEGPHSLTREEIAAKLKLDQVQKDKIRSIQRNSRPAERFDFRNATQEERQKNFAEARKRHEKLKTDLLAVLTPAQKEAFEKLQGEKFDFPRRSDTQNQ